MAISRWRNSWMHSYVLFLMNRRLTFLLTSRCCRCCHWRGAAVEWTTVAVYICSQSLYHQLYRVFVHHGDHRSQSLPVRLLARRLRHGVHSPTHGHRCGLDVAGRGCHRPAEPRWLVVALVRHQDSEVYVGPHHSLPIHHLLRPRRHAAAVCYHRGLLLVHFRSHSTCQATASQNTVSGKTQHILKAVITTTI